MKQFETDLDRWRNSRPTPWALYVIHRYSKRYLHRRPSLEKSLSNGLAATSTSNSLDSAGEAAVAEAAKRPRSTRGSQKWSNVRAVMTLYSSLRKIKRYLQVLVAMLDSTFDLERKFQKNYK